VDIAGEYRISASQQAVWEALNNPDVLKLCIPGCQSLTVRSDTDIDAVIVAQLGPVKSTFAAQIRLADLNPPHRYTLAGEGKSGVAGFGRGQAHVALVEEQGVTILRYQADFKLGGKLAQIGSRLLEGAMRKLVDEFFLAFALQLDRSAQRGASATAESVPGKSRLPLILGSALVILVLLWWLMRRRLQLP
jgi:carbon monoxide dehydrogenase subunit G